MPRVLRTRTHVMHEAHNHDAHNVPGVRLACDKASLGPAHAPTLLSFMLCAVAMPNGIF